jgi:transcription elongation factor Elf1
MATCSNCKKSLSCGCQKRKASNGTSVCSNCSAAYEKTISKATIQPTNLENKIPTISSKPQVWGKDRYIKK